MTKKTSRVKKPRRATRKVLEKNRVKMLNFCTTVNHSFGAAKLKGLPIGLYKAQQVLYSL